ncbi:MAG: acyloxyacyl hydrolase [Paracoccaceae bacterium]
MADGTFAALMFILGLSDMQSNHCGTELGCLGRSEGTARIYASAGEVVKRRARPGPETYFRYDLAHKNGPFGNAVGFSITERQEAWVGYGQTYLIQAEAIPVKAELHAMTGLYDKGLGHGLGGRIAFRSGIDLIYETNGGVRYALSYDHRSHIAIYKENPGMETIQFAVSFPLK